jgi:hypothetical protein
LGYSIAELHNLKLAGKLSIEVLKNVDSLSEAVAANSVYKKDLHELRLSWSKSVRLTYIPISSAEQVIEALKPHSNLENRSL